MTEQYPALVTDYDVEWLDVEDLPEGTRHDHGWIHLDNGYTISVLRSNAAYETLGYNEGKWEAVVGKPATGLAAALGLTYEPATELEHLLNNSINGVAVHGPLDSAGVTEFVATVAEQPKVEAVA
jgi:hypothetical protein